MKIPTAPVGSTVALPGTGSGVMQKPSDFAAANAGKEMIPPEMIAAVKADEERQQTLDVIEKHNSFADKERQMLDQVRQTEGKNALTGPDHPAVYDQALEWYNKEAQAVIETLPSDRQKLLMTRMVGSNRDRGLDAVALHQSQQQKVHAESVSSGAVQAAKQAVGLKWGDVSGVDQEFVRAAAAIDAAHPGQDNTQRKILAQQDIYGHALNLALAYGDKDNFAYANELLYGRQGNGFDPSKQPGLTEPGNIDLLNRPRVKNADGSISTVRSMSVEMDGQTVLLPTVAADGSGILSNEDAIAQYQATGQHLGKFKDAASADRYALALHKDQERLLNQGIRDKISPEMQAHAVTTLRVQEKSSATMNSYFSVMADAGRDPAKAVALLNDPGYVAQKGLKGDTWNSVMAMAEGRAHYLQGQQDRARNRANESASKSLYSTWVANNGQMSPEALMEFARKNPGAAHLVVPFMQNAQRAVSEETSARADYAMFQASLSGDLSSKGYQLLAQHGPALSASRRDHWSKIVADGVNMKPAHGAFKQSAAMAGLVFDEKAGDNESKQKANAEYVRTLRAYEDEVRRNPNLSQADMQKVADKYVAPVVTARTSWGSGPGFWDGLFGVSGERATFGSAVYGGGEVKFRGDRADLKPTAKQMSALGMIPNEEAALKYYQTLGKDSLIIRQGVLAQMEELNAKRQDKYPVNEKTIQRIERDALAKYGPDYLYKKGQVAWIKAQQ